MSVHIVGGLVLAGGLVAVYRRTRDRPPRVADISDIVLTVATSTALIAGVLLVVAITSASLGPFGPEDRLFIPVAGLALVLVSGKEIAEVIADRPFNRSP